MTVSADVSFVIVLVRTFFTLLIEVAEKASIDPKNPLKLAIESIHLKEIREGSAILSGSMSTDNPAQSNALANSLSDSLTDAQL